MIQKPIVCKSEATGNTYRVTRYKDLGEGKILAIEKERIVAEDDKEEKR